MREREGWRDVGVCVCERERERSGDNKHTLLNFWGAGEISDPTCPAKSIFMGAWWVRLQSQ